MIIRRRHTANFTTIGNKLFDDERLQPDELGILTYLLSRPNDWEVRRPFLRKRFRVGRDALRRIVCNWVKYGWATACRKRLDNGTFYTIYEIRDEPGPELTDDEVKTVFSLASGEAAVDDLENELGSSDTTMATNPPWSADNPHPSDALPDTADPPLVLYKTLPNTEDTKSERELARAREKHALNLAEFKRRYPTAASDDQAKIDEEWFKLEFAEGDAALTGIVAFLAKLKADKRTTTPAAWKYLRDKRWTLLQQTEPGTSSVKSYPIDSVEARAILILHEMVSLREFMMRVSRSADGGLVYRGTMNERLMAMAQAPAPDHWVTLTFQQSRAWERFLCDHITVNRIRRLSEGSRAPWPWPPSVDGKLYTTATGPPETLMSEQDIADFK